MSNHPWTQRDLLNVIDTWTEPPGCHVQIMCNDKHAKLSLVHVGGNRVSRFLSHAEPVGHATMLLDVMVVALEVRYGSRNYSPALWRVLFGAGIRFNGWVDARYREPPRQPNVSLGLIGFTFWGLLNSGGWLWKKLERPL